MKLKIWLGVFSLIVLGLAVWWLSKNQTVVQYSNLPKATLSITDRDNSQTKLTLTIELAKTTSELQNGLSGRRELATGSGMYFILGKEDFATFWMKDMKFPIDIIWIKQNKIVGIEKNAPILKDQNSIPTFHSPIQVTNVLEINANLSEENNLLVGDQVKIYEN